MEWTQEDFAAAVTEHSRRMYRAARSVLDSGADAEDAVGQAVLLAWQSLDRLRDKGAVRPWLVKIAVNCAYAQRRKRGRVVSLEDLDREPAAQDPPRYDGLWEAVSALADDFTVRAYVEARDLEGDRLSGDMAVWGWVNIPREKLEKAFRALRWALTAWAMTRKPKPPCWLSPAGGR